MLIDDLTFSLPRNGIVGIIGPNGVGKTTLFKTIVGLEKPDAGEVRVGETVMLSYVDQSRSGLDPHKSVWEVVSDGLDYLMVGKVEMPSRAYIAAFGFKGPDQQKPTGVLSGGERNRLNLALTLKIGGNVILLDEPTNDLDAETLSVAGERAAGVPRLRRGRSLTTGCSWTGWPPTSWRGRAPTRTRRAGSGSRATSRRTRRTRSTGSAPRRRARTG